MGHIHNIRRWGKEFPHRPIHDKPFAASLARLMVLWLAAIVVLAALPSTVEAADGWSADSEVIAYGIDTSDDGSLVVAGRRDNLVVAWNAAGEELWTFETGGTVYGVSVSSDGQRIAVASEDRHVYLLDSTGTEVWNYRGPQTFLSVSISGDGQIIAAGSEDRTVSLLDAAGTLAWQYQATDHVNQVAVYGGESGFRIIAGTRDSRLSLLSGDGQLGWETTLDYTVRGVDVTPNGAHIVAGDASGNLVLVDGASGNVLWKASVGTELPAVAISRGGDLIVAGSTDGSFATFDIEGKELQRQTVADGVWDVALTADGGVAALATETGVTVAANDGSGAFDLPEAPSQFAKFIWPIAIALGVLLLVIVALGLRKKPDGQRAWRSAGSDSRNLAADIWKARVSYIFLIPTLVLLLIFNYYPAFSGIYHAFTEWTPGFETKWVGLDQFRDLRENRYFWVGIGNLVILIVTGFLKLLIPLAVAEMIFHLRSSRLAYGFRTLFVLQVIVPGVVGVLLWVNVYDPNIGLANQVLEGLGLGNLTRSWLGDADTAIWSIVFIGFPWVSAFALLIFYGGLISIPTDLFDSASLDGASTFRRILNIDLPLLLGQVRLLVILTFIATVQEFAAIFLTTGGGPGSSTYVPSLELYYQAVRFNNFGMASAIGTVLFIVIMAGTIINLRYVKSSVEYST
jgi:ABC-type sugar transport system permease subunit/outer membrane protein assembly factor BamB